jgi:hypothetical protein
MPKPPPGSAEEVEFKAPTSANFNCITCTYMAHFDSLSPALALFAMMHAPILAGVRRLHFGGLQGKVPDQRGLL